MKNYQLLAGALISISASALAQVPVSAPAATTQPAPVPIPAAPAQAAPDVQQQVSQGLTEYQQKNYGKAADALDAAAAQIRKMKSNVLAQFLPAAPTGWTTKEEPGALYRMNIPGMGSQAERSYLSGGEEIKISITSDSRLMGTMRKLNASANPPMQFMGHDYFFKPADANLPAIMRKNEGTLFVDEHFTISVSGDKLTDQQAQGFLGLIDLAKLKIEADK